MENLKLSKDKCHFRCTSVPIFGEVMSRHGIQPNPQKLKALTEMPPKMNRELPSISWNNYLGIFSPSTADTCELLRNLMSVKTEWTLNPMYQKMFNKAKAIIKEDAYMKFYYETKLLYIDMDASGVGLGTALLQTKNNTSCPKDEATENSILIPIAFASKCLTRAEKKIQQYRK